MWLSSTAQQAIGAVTCIAGSSKSNPMRVDEIAAAIGCPRNYLSKTLYQLARAGVLRSVRGPLGGFLLAVPADKLTLKRIVALFEPLTARRCLIGRARCSDADPCAVHDRWHSVATSLEQFFENTTVQDLIAGNPRAATETREAILTLCNSTRRIPDGSVA